MNELSIFIYLADVVGDLEGFAISTMVLGAAAAATLIRILLVRHAEGWEDLGDVNRKRVNQFLRWVLASFIISGLIVVVFPSRDTMYMMAASEVGEELLVTPEMVKLRAIINEQLEDIVDQDQTDR